MRVFVTGASGGIGSAVVAELLSHGHQVIGLARSKSSAAAVIAAGAEVVNGGLEDEAVLRDAAAASDGVIHLAFGHDFTRFAESAEQETRTVSIFSEALVGSGRPLVIASGTPAVPGRASTEEDPAPTDGPTGARGRSVKVAIEAAEHDVRSSVVRLPRSVHLRGADGAFGFAGILIDAARKSGVSAYVGDGTQRWPAVNRLDAARLFRLALENAEPGSVLHAVADEGDPMIELSTAIGTALSLPVEAVDAESFGFLGMVFGVDQPSSSVLTQQRFNWEPEHPSLLEDLASGDYPG